jgi:ribose 5-phosphate isomerase A
MDLNTAKEAVGQAAASLIKPGMIVGLGTGSTTTYFIQYLGQRCQDEGLQVSGIPTSERTRQQAIGAGITIADIDNTTFVDVAVDGADEVDDYNQLIKGGGGALLREKIVAAMSREFIVIVDSSKVVKQLGSFPLPIEIVPFAYKATVNRIQRLGYRGAIRRNENADPILTENGHYLFDIRLPHPMENPYEDDIRLKKIPGVVETGLFINMVSRVLIGYPDGHVEMRKSFYG